MASAFVFQASSECDRLAAGKRVGEIARYSDNTLPMPRPLYNPGMTPPGPCPLAHHHPMPRGQMSVWHWQRNGEVTSFVPEKWGNGRNGTSLLTCPLVT